MFFNRQKETNPEEPLDPETPIHTGGDNCYKAEYVSDGKVKEAFIYADSPTEAIKKLMENDPNASINFKLKKQN